MKVNKDNSALIIVDIQNDFLEGGALEVKESNSIIDIVNSLQDHFSEIVATQDWHPANHKSFASMHTGKNIGDFINLNSVNQILWPDHCIQETFGSEFSSKLKSDNINRVIQKGSNPEIDSYSGFLENDKKTKTKLHDYLQSKNIKHLFICGLASDYCVKFTCLDAVDFGYDVYLVENATKAVNINADDHIRAIEEMKNHGVKIINSKMLM